MPLYDYTCKKCSQTFELLIISSTKAACPHCGSAKLQRLVSAPVAPGRSGAIMAAGRARAVKEGHACNYRRANGKIVD
jgi:putative FmdB family regulatory protein